MKKKVAIVGGGGGGLGCAYVLGQVADVTVYEANPYLGGHARTVDFPCADGVTRPVDMGILITDPWSYPVLYALVKKHNIETRATGWTFGAAFGKDDWWYTGGPRTELWKRVRADASRFELDAVHLNDAPIQERLKPVGVVLKELGYSDEFAAKVLSPILTLLVVTRTGLLTSPILNILGLFSDKQLSFFNGTQWRMFPGGSREYIQAIVQNTPATYRTSTPVKSVARTAQGVVVTDGQNQQQTFDHIVFATPADITLKLLSDPTPAEQGLLAAFTWQQAELYLHSDDSVLSKHLPDKLCSQYHYAGADPTPELQGTFSLNPGVGLGFPKKAGPVLITGYNAGSKEKRPKASKVVAQATWQHEIMTLEQMGARQQLHAIQGVKGTWHCGTTAVWPSADAVLTSGMVLARHLDPQSVFPFDEPAAVADFTQIEQVMFPGSPLGPGASAASGDEVALKAPAPEPAVRPVKHGFRRLT